MKDDASSCLVKNRGRMWSGCRAAWLGLLLLTACFPTWVPPPITMLPPEILPPLPPASTPARRWQVPVRGQTLDLLEVLPGGRVLVGGVDTAPASFPSDGFLPVYRDLSMHDLATGRELWRFDRATLQAEWSDVIGFDPIVVSYVEPGGSHGYLALDRETGRHLWDSTGYEWLRIHPELPIALALDEGMFSSELTAVRLSDGAELWTYGVDKHLQSSAVELVGEDVYVVGEELVRLDAQTGSKLWASSLPGGAPSFMRLSLAAERVVAADQGRVVAFARKDGAVAWTYRAAAAQVVSLGVEGGRVLTTERRSGGYGLVALELSSGKVLWEAGEPRRQQTPLLMEGTRACYATDVALVCRELADGHEVVRAPVPYSLLLLDAAPWRISLVGRRLVLATNVAVAAYDLEAGAWAFASDHTSRTHLPMRLLSRTPARGAPQADSGQSADAPWTSTLSPSEFFLWQAQRNLDFARGRTQVGSAEQRRRAQSDAAMAARGVSTLSSIHSSFERTEAVVAFTGALLGVFDAMKADFQRSEALDHAWNDADALRAHGRMLQERFHVRQLDTDELQLIDVSAGTVGRIALRLYDQLLRTRVRSAVVVDGGKALLTTAPHTERSLRASQGKVSWRSSEYDLVPQYLTLMELGDVELRPLPAPRGNMWMRVANTIAKGDLELLPKLLVYANKPDPDQLVGGSLGITPLMLSAYLGQVEVAKWLLGQGAGLDARDVVGWRPIDYARAGEQPAMVELLSSVAAARRAAAAPRQP